MSDGRVQIVTVAFDSDDALTQFLNSCKEHAPAGTAICVVDNAPALGSAKAIAKRFKASYLPLSSNPGYGGAINASQSAWSDEAEYILIANPDVQLGEGSIQALVAALSADSSVGAVGPLIRNGDGTVYPSARAVPSVSTGVGHALLHGVWPSNPWTRKYHAANEDIRERECGWLSGACLLVRRSAFEQLGGFDESFFMYFEDVDLGYRLGNAGWSVRYVPSAEVVHSGAHSTTDRKQSMRKAHHDSAAQFLAKRYPAWWQAPVRLSLRAGLSVRSALSH